MQPRGRKRIGGDRIRHLNIQAERARKMASTCGSPILAELFELHAALCERNAEARLKPKRKTVLD